MGCVALKRDKARGGAGVGEELNLRAVRQTRPFLDFRLTSLDLPLPFLDLSLPLLGLPLPFRDLPLLFLGFSLTPSAALPPPVIGLPAASPLPFLGLPAASSTTFGWPFTASPLPFVVLPPRCLPHCLWLTFPTLIACAGPVHLKAVGAERRQGRERGGARSRRRELCHSADAPSPSLLKHLLRGEGGAAEWQNSRRRPGDGSERGRDLLREAGGGPASPEGPGTSNRRASPWLL